MDLRCIKHKPGIFELGQHTLWGPNKTADHKPPSLASGMLSELLSVAVSLISHLSLHRTEKRPTSTSLLIFKYMWGWGLVETAQNIPDETVYCRKLVLLFYLFLQLGNHPIHDEGSDSNQGRSNSAESSW